MSCVRAILPKLGFALSFLGFSYIFLNIYAYDPGSLLLGVILVLTSSFLVLTFSIIKCIQCRRVKTYGQQKQEEDSSGTFQQDKDCFMKLWNLPKQWHWAPKALYYGTLMPVVIFVSVGLFLGIVIYFASGILIFYLIFKQCAKRKARKQGQKAKYDGDSELDVSSSKK